jgi:DNA-binding transcriptional ArsR family regulator
MRESLWTDDLYVMKTLDRAPAAPQLEVRAPGTAGPLVDATEMSRFLARWLPTSVSRPTVFAINLEGIYLSPAALRELLVPLGQAGRAGTYGELVVVICTSDAGTIDVARALAQANNLALYAAPSPQRVGEAQPLGPLTPTEEETLEVLWRLGGHVTVASFARETGLAASAATNRLVSVLDKGLVYREERPRRQGVLFGDPRAARQTDALPEELERELEAYVAMTGLTREELLIAAWHEHGQEAGAQAQPGDHALAVAWQHFRRARGEELSKRTNRGRAILSDPGAASIAASGMDADRIERVRRAFE